MSGMDKDSIKGDAVLELMAHVWYHANEQAESFARKNNALRRALSLAIGGGFTFKAGTLARLAKWDFFEKWAGSDHEWMYTLAICNSNTSAALAYEHWKKRESIIADDVWCEGEIYGHRHGGSRQRERLAVGFKFTLGGRELIVNSWGHGYVNVAEDVTPAAKARRCMEEERDWKRYRVSRKDIARGHEEDAEKVRVLADMKKSQHLPKLNKMFLDAGIMRQDDFMKADIKVIRKIGAKACEKGWL